MSHEIIKLKSVHPTMGYSHCAKAGKTLYIAGQVAKDKTGTVIGRGNLRAQARQVYENLQGILEEAGGGLKNIVKMTTFITHPAFVEPYREMRNGFFTDPMPPNTLVVVTSLADPEFLIEVEAIAVLD